LKIPSLNADAKGDSYFTEVETSAPGSTFVGPGGPGIRYIDTESWQIWEMQPGHFQDFKPNQEPQCLAIMADKLAVTASVGETRSFARGDMLLLQDLTGNGHAVRAYGVEPCTVFPDNEGDHGACLVDGREHRIRSGD
jgi:hypothetical protein